MSREEIQAIREQLRATLRESIEQSERMLVLLEKIKSREAATSPQANEGTVKSQQTPVQDSTNPANKEAGGIDGLSCSNA